MIYNFVLRGNCVKRAFADAVLARYTHSASIAIATDRCALYRTLRADAQYARGNAGFNLNCSDALARRCIFRAA